MAIPTLTPSSTKSASVLPATGSTTKVAAACPIGFYTGSADFLAGAAAQVAFTYKKLGGDVLDIELTEQNVYANYEEAVIEYSYIINIHQSKNTLGTVLGAQTASFNHKGEVIEGPLSASLKYPKFSFETSFRVADAYSAEASSDKLAVSILLFRSAFLNSAIIQTILTFVISVFLLQHHYRASMDQV